MSALDLFRQHVNQKDSTDFIKILNDMKNLLGSLSEQQQRLAAAMQDICAEVYKDKVDTNTEDQDIDSMIQYHKSALSELYKKKNKVKQREKKMTYETAASVAELLNNFYIADFKKRKYMFEDKVQYVGQIANHKYLTLEEMSNYLDQIDNTLVKYKGVYLLPEAKTFFMKVYYYVGKYGDDSKYYEKVFLK